LFHVKKLPEDSLARLYMRFYSRLAKKKDLRTDWCIFLPLPNQKKNYLTPTQMLRINGTVPLTVRENSFKVHNELFFWVLLAVLSYGRTTRCTYV